jgi:hypothetical protein
LLRRFAELGWITIVDLNRVEGEVRAFAATSTTVPFPPVQGIFYNPNGLSFHQCVPSDMATSLAGLPSKHATVN